MPFYSLEILSIDHPTKDSVEVSFGLPSGHKKDFEYSAGQHLTLKAQIEGEEVRRSYSLCASPLDKKLSVVIKKVEGGKFSTFANEGLKVGDVIDVMPPVGKFTLYQKHKQGKNYVAFAAGSGITPIISIIETALRAQPESDFTLFYGNKSTSDIIFHERLEGLKNRFIDRFSYYNILSREIIEPELFRGRIDEQKVEVFSNLFFNVDTTDEYFICGPEAMMVQIKKTLNKLGVDQAIIHTELFTSPAGKLGTSSTSKKKDSKAKSEIFIVLDGKTQTFPYDTTKSILDCAIDQGLDLPFSCKGGVCSTCVCRIEEGQIEMEVNYALEEDELEKGLILSCQARPKSEKIKLNFDI